MVKRLPIMRETWVQSLGREDPLEKEMAAHFGTLAWRIPWTEKPGRLQSIGSQESATTWLLNHHNYRYYCYYYGNNNNNNHCSNSSFLPKEYFHLQDSSIHQLIFTDTKIVLNKMSMAPLFMELTGSYRE